MIVSDEDILAKEQGMQPRIDGQSGVGRADVLKEPNREHPSQKQGNYDGRFVTVAGSPSSLVKDAALNDADSTSEVEEKSLDERKLADKDSPDDGMAMQDPEYLIDKVVDWSMRKRVHDFVDHLKQNAGVTASQLRREARLFFSDVSDQYVGLVYAKAEIDRLPGFQLLKDGLAEVLAGLERDHGPEIRAGLNVADAARTGVTQGLGEAQGLRDLYRDTVLDYKGALAAYEAILEKYGPKDFMRAVHFLIKALGQDMASTGPSTSAEQLKLINDDLFQLEALNHLHEGSRNVLDRMRTVYNAPQAPEDPKLLMKPLLQMKDERWIASTGFESLATSLRFTNTGERIHFLREVKDLARQLPLKLYENPETRPGFLQAAQDALDEAIAREEA